MKTIIVGGASRSGKSIFCKMLATKHNICYLPLDTLVTTLGYHAPELKITDWGVEYEEVRKNVAPILCDLIENIGSTSNFHYVIDTHFLTPTDIFKYTDADQYKLVFIGYPHIDPATKIIDISNYAEVNECWTIKRYENQSQILEFVMKQIKLSKEIQQQCIDHSIEYINTSCNFDDTISAGFNSVTIDLGLRQSILGKFKARFVY